MKINANDLPKFTRRGQYNISISLDFFVESIERYKDKHKLILCPDFQRGHVWNEKQKIAFMEFVLKGGEIPQIRFNKPDWGIFNEKEEGNEMVLVDGLQRTTAIMEFFENKFMVFEKYYAKDIEILGIFDIPVSVNNLKTRKEVLNWYIEMNSGGTPHTEEEIEKVKELLNNA